MNHSAINLAKIQKEIYLKISENNKTTVMPQIIAVSKTFPLKEIIPLVNHGHIHFGENKIQEAIKKWTKLKTENREIKLHMIGKLQTNKVKYIFDLFDYLHSLDNLKLAEKISSEQSKKNKSLIDANMASLYMDSYTRGNDGGSCCDIHILSTMTKHVIHQK